MVSIIQKILQHSFFSPVSSFQQQVFTLVIQIYEYISSQIILHICRFTNTGTSDYGMQESIFVNKILYVSHKGNAGIQEKYIYIWIFRVACGGGCVKKFLGCFSFFIINFSVIVFLILGKHHLAFPLYYSIFHAYKKKLLLNLFCFVLKIPKRYTLKFLTIII